MSKPLVEMRNLKNRKLYLQVYDELKEYITQNHLQAGDKLPTEMEMCALLGVSRNVLREAIKALEISGVVSSKPGVGIVIQEFNAEYLFSNLLYGLSGGGENMRLQTKEVRRVLEVGFAREAFDSVTDPELETIRHQVDVMRSVVSEKANRTKSAFGIKFAEADATFHRTLYSKVGNDILSSIIDAFWVCDRYYMTATPRWYFDLTLEKHVRLLDALEARDYQRFYEALQFHYNVEYKPKLTD